MPRHVLKAHYELYADSHLFGSGRTYTSPAPRSFLLTHGLNSAEIRRPSELAQHSHAFVLRSGRPKANPFNALHYRECAREKNLEKFSCKGNRRKSFWKNPAPTQAEIRRSEGTETCCMVAGDGACGNRGPHSSSRLLKRESLKEGTALRGIYEQRPSRHQINCEPEFDSGRETATPSVISA